MVGIDDESFVAEFAHGTAFPTGRRVRLEQSEFATVMHDAHRQRTFLTAPSGGGFTVQGAETGIVELAGGRVQVGAVTSRRGRAPAERAARSLGTCRTAQFEVIRST